jgi:DNA-binding transcriptional ArsR family regulator/uncharacterized protein YndB with AHSA1/START domain
MWSHMDRRRTSESLDLLRVWKALADPHRRAMLDHLRQRPMTTGEIASQFAFSRFAAMKHLGVLVAAGLVSVKRQGKERWNTLNPVPLQQIYERWLKPFEAQTLQSLFRLKTLAESGASLMSATPLSSYTVNLDIPIQANAKAVWRAMTQDIGKWWPSHFFSNAKAKKFVMECKVGGRVYEDWGKKTGGEWGRLIVYQPNEKIIWAGTHFGGGAKNWGNFFVTIQLEEQGEGTVLKFEDSGFGMLDEGMRGSLESGWKELYGQHLKEYLELRVTKKKKKLKG